MYPDPALSGVNKFSSVLKDTKFYVVLDSIAFSILKDTKGFIVLDDSIYFYL